MKTIEIKFTLLIASFLWFLTPAYSLIESTPIVELNKNEPITISVKSIPTQAKPGDFVTVEIKTTPQAQCKLEVPRESISSVVALSHILADKYGFAKWTFEISKNYKANMLPILFTVAANNKVKKLISAIEINSVQTKDILPELCLFFMSSLTKNGEQQVTVKVRTTPGAYCKIDLQNSQMNQPVSLADKIADSQGIVSWVFEVNKPHKTKVLLVFITAEYKGIEKNLLATIDLSQIMIGK